MPYLFGCGLRNVCTRAMLESVVVDMDELEKKHARLEEQLGRMPSLIVAYSGGVDSAYLAYAAHRALGERMLAVTALSASYSARDRAEAEKCVARYDFRHEFISTDELANPSYRANQGDRCYFCKDELFAKLDELAGKRGFAGVAYGINHDDLGDWRPGQQAAREHKVLTPLLDAGLTKADIRELSRRVDLPVWDRPASACLSSRIAYGIEVTPERLAIVEKGEDALRALGFHQFRVRYHEQLVRLEISPEEMPRALSIEMTRKFVEIFKELGFKFVTLDLEGYRTGSMNSLLVNIQK
jgi:uncharacterized protein